MFNPVSPSPMKTTPFIASVCSANSRLFENFRINKLRNHAVDTVLRNGLVPQLKDQKESWRFFDIRPFDRESFQIADPNSNKHHLDLIDQIRLPEAKGSTVVLLNGVLNRELSDLDNIPGIELKLFDELTPRQQNDIIERFIVDKQRCFPNDSFAAINTALLENIAILTVRKDTVVEQPLHVVYLIDDEIKVPPSNDAPTQVTEKVDDSEQTNTMAHNRLLVAMEHHAKLTLIEEWISDTSLHLVNSFTQVELAEGADLRHIRAQRNNDATFHVDRLAVEVAANSRYDSCSYGFGSARARSDIHLLMNDREAWARIDGVAVLNRKQEIDTHTIIENCAPQVTSHQLYKIVATEQSHGIFNGNILVKPNSQKIKSYQLNRNLILGRKARVDAKPQLEIFADDVECSHGSATGQLDDEQVFYLETRGIPPTDARAILTFAFAAEVVDNIPVVSLKKRLTDEIYHRIQNVQ